jgi:putative ABC transport system permease protein
VNWEEAMFKLALKRIFHSKVSSLVTMITVALTVIVFLLLNSSLKSYGDRLTERTDNPLLIAGSRGSGVDLIMKSLYFRKSEQPFIKNVYIDAVREHAEAAPLFIEYTAENYPVCSTTPEYFDLRGLTVSNGTMLTKLGDCILGAKVAAKLKLKPGEFLISDPDNVFNPAGSIPLKMRITGILEETGSPDDSVIFTSLKTGWTMHGLGHAHPPELEGPDLKQSYIEINEETLKTFHFHGEEDEYPLTAILLKPKSPKDEAFLLGKSAVSPELSVAHPGQGLKSFLKMLFHLDKLFLIILVLVLTVIVMLLLLIFFLNLRLRRKEKSLFDRLGFEQVFFARLAAAEWIILLSGGILCGWAGSLIFNPLLKQLFDTILRG